MMLGHLQEVGGQGPSAGVTREVSWLKSYGDGGGQGGEEPLPPDINQPELMAYQH
jgi:hypothetical protein